MQSTSDPALALHKRPRGHYLSLGMEQERMGKETILFMYLPNSKCRQKEITKPHLPYANTKRLLQNQSGAVQ